MEVKCPRCLTVFPSQTDLFKHIENGCKRALADIYRSDPALPTGKSASFHCEIYKLILNYLLQSTLPPTKGPLNQKSAERKTYHLVIINVMKEVLHTNHIFSLVAGPSTRPDDAPPVRHADPQIQGATSGNI